MVAVVAHPHGGPLQGTLAVLLPGERIARIHHVLADVEDIHRRQVSLAVGVVEVPVRVGGIAAGIHGRASHLPEILPDLRARSVVEAPLPQADLGPVEEELAPLDPELPEAELLVVLVVQARAGHFQPEGVEVGLAHVPEARVGPRPGERKGLRLLRLHGRVRSEGLLHRALFVEHLRDELDPARLLDAGKLHVQRDVALSCRGTHEDVGHPRLGCTAFQKDAAGQAPRLKPGRRCRRRLLKAFCQNCPTFSGSAMAATSSRISAVLPGVTARVMSTEPQGQATVPHCVPLT